MNTTPIKLPLRLDNCFEHGGNGIAITEANEDCLVFSKNKGNLEAYALIVCAVNNHQALLTALEQISEAASNADYELCEEIADTALAALAEIDLTDLNKISGGIDMDNAG